MPLRTTFDDGQTPRRKFQHFSNREVSQICRSLGIPVNILDLLEAFNQMYGLDPEKIREAAEAGCPIAKEVNDEITRTKMLAMEGLIVQQSLENLGKVQAENDQQQALINQNKAAVGRIRELEAYVKSLVIAVTEQQLRNSLPYLAIAFLLIAFIAFIGFSKNGHNTPPVRSVPTSIQSPK